MAFKVCPIISEKECKATEELDKSTIEKVDFAINQQLAYEWDIASMFDYGNCGIHISYTALKRI